MLTRSTCLSQYGWSCGASSTRKNRVPPRREQAPLAAGCPRETTPAIAIVQLDLIGVEADEGDDGGAVLAPASRAVAIRDPARRQRRDEAHRAAEAGAGGCGGHCRHGGFSTSLAIA